MRSPTFAANEFRDAVPLDEGERLLVIACRMWVACIADRNCPLCPLAAAFHDVLCTTARAATRPFQVHGPLCPHISEDEVLLLRAAAFAQRRQLPAALRELQDWLPDAAAQWALGSMRDLALALSEAGLLLPLAQRSLDSPEHAQLRGAIACTVH